MRVALRDASFYGSARFAEGRTQHYVPTYHAINPDSPYLSRCGRLLASETETDHHAVVSRCGRPGCRQAFVAAMTEQQGGAGGR